MKIVRTPAVLALAFVGALALSACGGSDSSEATDEQICADVQSLDDAVDAIATATSEDEAIQLLSDASDAAQDMVKTAPAEVKADVEVLAQGFAALAGATSGESADEALADVDEEVLGVAGDNFEQFASETCGIELG